MIRIAALLLCLILLAVAWHAAAEPAVPSRVPGPGSVQTFDLIGSAGGSGCALHVGAILPTLAVVTKLLTLSFDLPLPHPSGTVLLSAPTPPPPKA